VLKDAKERGFEPLLGIQAQASMAPLEFKNYKAIYWRLQAWACHWEALGFEPQPSPFPLPRNLKKLPRNPSGGQGV
jgi:hypothetical protein